MAHGLVRQGDKLYLYYGVYYAPHGFPLDPRNHVSRAELRLDGFVSVEAGQSMGRLKTVPLTFAGDHLELNVKGEAARVALVDEYGGPFEGLGLADCDPVSGDHTAATVTWGGRHDLGRLAGRPVHLVLALRNASLYAFQFR